MWGIEIEAERVSVRVGQGADVARIAAPLPRVDGKPVFGPSDNVRVMVGTNPVDFRKRMEGLAMLMREHMQGIRPRTAVLRVFPTCS